MIGNSISNYKIIEKLGEGGMGVVYKAQDTSLNRSVALKFLPSYLTNDISIRKRFIVEAQTASAIDHPNICNVHEINETSDGQIYICMAYYSGESLRHKLKKGPLRFEESLDIFYQIVQGLNAAHEEKIVHRDIKPGNIIITDKGVAKIVDFGLARLAGEKLTESISTKGTIAYMAPEVIRGLEVDHRADIWSLGIVLFEMLSGHLPFKGEYPEPIMYSIVNEEPKPLSQYLNNVPDVLLSIVEKLLKKNPNERYQDLSALLIDLKTLVKREDSELIKRKSPIVNLLSRNKPVLFGTMVILLIILFFNIGRLYLFPNGREGNFIAVLPIKNISNEIQQDWFTEGMTDALITDLTQISGLRVISNSTVMKYKGTNKTLPEIADELNVQYLVELSILKMENQLQVSAKLLNAYNAEYIWAKNYDRNFNEVFILFSEAAQDIANEIETELTPKDRKRLANVRSVNTEAYELYLKGIYHLNKWTQVEVKKAFDYFQRAIKVDSNFAMPYVGLIYYYGFSTYYGSISRVEGIPKIYQNINKALELDRNLAEAYQGLAATRVHQEWDFTGAGEAFKKAMELNPNLFGILGTEYAWYLTYIGHIKEAIAETERLMQVDPLSLVTRMTANYVYYCARQYEKAIDICIRTIELEPHNFKAYEDLAINYEQLSRYDDAHKSRLAALKLSGVKPEMISNYDSLYNVLGLKAYPTWLMKNRTKLNSWLYKNLSTAAWIYTKLDNSQRALSYLEQAYAAKEGELVTIKTDPKWDQLRGESRFQDLLKKMKFPD